MKKLIRHNHDDVPKSTYTELLKRPLWRQKRKQILNRDNKRCLHCNNNKNLHIHHRQYQFNTNKNSMINPWEYDNKYLITLCKTCHSNGHKLFKVPVINI